MQGAEPAHCCAHVNKVLLLVFMVALAAAILAGNCVTLAVVLGTRALRTPQGLLKASLAAADLAVGLLVVPLSVHAEASLLLRGASAPDWITRDSRASRSFHPCAVVGPVFAGCTLVSVSTVFLLAVERCVAVLRPLHRDSVVTRGRTGTLIACSWLAGSLLAAAPLLLGGGGGGGVALEYNRCSRMCNYYAPGGAEGARNILLLFPAFDFTLLGATVLVNVVSLSSIRRHSRRRRRLARSDAARPTFSSSDVRATRTIGALTLAFAASFAPVAVFVVGNVLGNEWCHFSFVAFWTLASNSCWNVVIYGTRDRRFRLRARRLLAGLSGDGRKAATCQPGQARAKDKGEAV